MSKRSSKKKLGGLCSLGLVLTGGWVSGWWVGWMGTRTSPEAWIGGRNGGPADVPLDATSTHGGDRVRSVCAEGRVLF
jgi:hypothetical protein